MNTAKKWLETLPEPYKSEALKAIKDNEAEKTFESLHDAIIGSIDFTGDSVIVNGKERFWSNIHRKVEDYALLTQQYGDEMGKYMSLEQYLVSGDTESALLYFHTRIKS